jgi:hypothetical protein
MKLINGEMHLSVDLPPQFWNQLLDIVGERPHKQVNEVIGRILMQVRAQEQQMIPRPAAVLEPPAGAPTPDEVATELGYRRNA